jgi:hypothetical protein
MNLKTDYERKSEQKTQSTTSEQTKPIREKAAAAEIQARPFFLFYNRPGNILHAGNVAAISGG